ncbi:MAG: Flagellar FliJ protein [Verrucomicrobiota bacterium]|jgi:flagellar export protein FliJ
MKPFKYALQAVRTLREQQEQAALQEYGAALRTANQAADELASVRQEQDAVWEQLQAQFAGPGTAEDLVKLQAYSQTVERRRLHSENLLHLAQQHMEQQFIRLVAARQAAAVLEKHFQTQQRHHQHRQRRQEQKILDELAGRQNLLRGMSTLKRFANSH